MSLKNNKLVHMGFWWNPFSTFLVSVILVCGLYALGYSDIYPSLGAYLLVFFAVIVMVTTYACVYVVGVKNEVLPQPKPMRDWILAFAISTGYVVECIAFGGIPLLSASSGNLDYREFGLPTIHVVLVGLLFFFSIYWFDIYVVTRKKIYLLMYFGGIFWPIATISRGGLIVVLVASVAVFGNRVGVRKHVMKLILLAAVVIVLFGVLGDYRSSAMGQDLEDPILSIGGANARFASSGLPNSFFWFYIYASSPLANLQQSISNSVIDLPMYFGFAMDFVPDFVSKRLVPEEFWEIASSLRVTPELTVGTAYARPYIALGFIGPYLLHLYFIFFALLCVQVSRRSRYGGAIMGLASAQGMLMFFDNMVTFAGTMCPLLVGIVLSMFADRHPTGAKS